MDYEKEARKLWHEYFDETFGVEDALKYLKAHDARLIREYRCESCKTEFEIRRSDWEDSEDYLEVAFCPICGKGDE